METRNVILIIKDRVFPETGLFEHFPLSLLSVSIDLPQQTIHYYPLFASCMPDLKWLSLTRINEKVLNRLQFKIFPLDFNC